MNDQIESVTLDQQLRQLAGKILRNEPIDKSAPLEVLIPAADKLVHMKRAFMKSDEVISQACGKALGYPWFKDDQINFPGATEEHGVCIGEHCGETIALELVDAYRECRARRYSERAEHTKKLCEVTEQAWGIIANVNWETQTPEWRAAAERWRDEHVKRAANSRAK